MVAHNHLQQIIGRARHAVTFQHLHHLLHRRVELPHLLRRMPLQRHLHKYQQIIADRAGAGGLECVMARPTAPAFGSRSSLKTPPNSICAGTSCCPRATSPRVSTAAICSGPTPGSRVVYIFLAADRTGLAGGPDGLGRLARPACSRKKLGPGGALVFHELRLSPPTASASVTGGSTVTTGIALFDRSGLRHLERHLDQIWFGSPATSRTNRCKRSTWTSS